MNTTPEQLRLIADIIEGNKPFEVRRFPDHSWQNPGHEIGWYIADNRMQAWEIRVKPWSLSRHIHNFRPLRDGEEWHFSSDEWKDGDLGDGERPVLRGEQYRKGDFRWSCGFGPWTEVSEDGDPDGLAAGHTRFKTRRPIPEPTPEPKPVPLCAEDINPSDVFKGRKGGPGFYKPVAVEPAGILFVFGSGTTWMNWEKLKADFVRLTPGHPEWQPCSKLP